MSGSWTRWLVFAFGLGAALAPGAAGQILAGVPLSAPALAFVALAMYAAQALPSPRWNVGRWLAVAFCAVIALKLLAAATAPPLGLSASYWAKATPDGPPERSTEFLSLANATRLDPALDLRGEDFPVHFFNDAARFNFGPEVQPGRDQMPFFVRWQGWLIVPSDGERRVVVAANGPTRVWLADAEVAAADSRFSLSSGLHALRVEYTRPEATVPRLTLSWERVPGGPLVAVGGPDVRYTASDASPAPSASLALAADALAVAALGAWLMVGLRVVLLRREGSLFRVALGAVPLALLLHGLLFHAPLAGRATILSGLDDWLIYESSARDILLNGWLMDGGQGHGPAFYGQPLYPYVLALAHRLTGESVFGPLALQFASLGLVLVGAAVLARRAFGSRLDGLVALACLWLLMQLEAEHFKVARQLFNENLYMPLVMVSLIAVVSLARDRRPTVWWRAALVGGLLGLTVISRSQFLLFVPLGLLVLLLAWRQARLTALPPLLAMVAGVVLVIAPVTARNWVVSGQFVPISSSGGASLLEFHRPPPGLIDPTSLEREPLFQALRLDTQTRTVLGFVRADPGGYLATLLPLGAHSVGLQGRNDPGIYWPLFVTTLLYLASFALARTRRLHVWPIHVFIGTHLLVLMLFEADTYGYRLVMPMYGPMVVVAAQVPLAFVRALLRSSPGAALRSGDARRATRFAAAGWAAVATVALLLQARGLIELWPQRDTALHGLGGPAAQAALTSDGVAAEAIYVASIDGTPRRFGAGNLTGLRYPWFKWFDPARSLPVPAGPGAAVYVLSELNGHTVSGGLVDCLGPPDASFQVVARAADVRGRCASGLDAASSPVIFDGLARVDAVGVPATSEAGRPLETRLLWQPLVAHPDPQQLSLQLDDPQAGDGTQWGNGTLELYPARQWQPGEALLSRVPVDTDGTALPQAYRLTLGMTSTKPNAPPATALWQGARTDRVPIGAVTLTAGSGTTATKLPADMRALEGKSLSGGGLELIAARPLPSEMAIGGPLKIGLLWRAMQDAPAAAQFRMRLLRADGEIVQESVLPVLGGRISPSALRAGNVVRDEQTVLISARAPTETLALEVAVLDEGTRLGSIKMTGRPHTLDPSAKALTAFGSLIDLLDSAVEPAAARGGEKVTVKLRWRAAAEMQQAYKVFVHVLDPAGQQVVAQRDAEPQDGRAPTTGWVTHEVIEDEYAMTLPASAPAGQYPVEIGIYDPKTGERLKLADGDNRLLLPTLLTVR